MSERKFSKRELYLRLSVPLMLGAALVALANRPTKSQKSETIAQQANIDYRMAQGLGKQIMAAGETGDPRVEISAGGNEFGDQSQLRKFTITINGRSEQAIVFGKPGQQPVATAIQQGALYETFSKIPGTSGYELNRPGRLKIDIEGGQGSELMEGVPLPAPMQPADIRNALGAFESELEAVAEADGFKPASEN